MTSPVARRVHLFGVDIDALTMDQTVDRIVELLDSGAGPVQHVVLNASKVVMMSKDDALRDVIARCPVVNADGMSVVVASKLVRRPLPERVAGIDLFEHLVERSARDGKRVYFLGAHDETLTAMSKLFLERFPDLQMAGMHNGYWDDDQEVIEDVSASHADLLFLAIPSPRKEFWLDTNLPALGVPFVMGVGGSFDVLAGKVQRAPMWAQKWGLEWAYRLVQEPRRMWKRYLVGNTTFMWLTLKEMVKRR